MIITVRIDTGLSGRMAQRPALELAWALEDLAKNFKNQEALPEPPYADYLHDSADDNIGWIKNRVVTMSIVDSISEDLNETLSALLGWETEVRRVYDQLSVIWNKYPDEEMVYQLDSLLKFWEALHEYRTRLETYADKLGEEL